jgi:hypothetical protein
VIVIKFCKSCFEIYREEFIGESCPKIKCGGAIHEADEMIAPLVRLLFTKGYYIESSSSGHADDPHSLMWILFGEGITVENYPNIMDVSLDDDGKLLMRKSFLDSESILSRQKEIFFTICALVKWAESLEICL